MKTILTMILSMLTVTGFGLLQGEAAEDILKEIQKKEVSQMTCVDSDYTSEQLSVGFDAAFLKEALKQNNNFVISPLSAKFALNMATLGATDNSATQQELLNLFGYKKIDTLTQETEMLMKALDREDETITIDNSVWMSDKFEKANETYVKTLEDVFDAEYFSLDLTSDKFVKKINNWIDDKTNGLISQMLSQPLDERARLALVNTLYFNNEWQNKFEYGSTFDADFHGINGTETVPTMHSTDWTVGYAESSKLKSICLNYRDMSKMKIYLPINEDENIADYIKEMTIEELLEEFEQNYCNTKVNIALPKFECDCRISIVEMLSALGVSEAFDPNNAKFGKISEDQLYISDVIQAAKIICDEEGTEAAAATMVIMKDAAMFVEEPPKEFIVDHPFMYEIEAPSGETLFMGVIQSFNN